MTHHAGSPTVSACLIVRNEAHVLQRCLASLQDVVDEIVVLDTGSTDDTPEIATRNGARVLRAKWPDDFAAARNISLEAATCDWILAIDADEYLPPDDARLVRPAVQRTDAMGLWLTQRNLQRPGDVLQFVDTRIVRLFRRRPEVYYSGIIHEEVTTSIECVGGRIAGTPIVIMHDGYTSETAQSSGTRASRNLPLLLRAAAAAPDDPYWHYQLGVTYQSTGRVHEARRHLQQVFQLPHVHLNTRVLSNAAIRLAQLAMVDKRHGSVVRYADIALQHEPGDALAHYLAGVALARLSRYAEARAHLTAVRESGRAGASSAADVDALLAYCARQTGADGSRGADGGTGEPGASAVAT